MRTSSLVVSAIFASGLMAVQPVQASYTAKCDALIGAWNKCRETGGSCSAERQKIVEQCKCHRYQQGEWKLVMAAVGKNGVCAPPWPGQPVPDPSPPPHDRTDGTERRN